MRAEGTLDDSEDGQFIMNLECSTSEYSESGSDEGQGPLLHRQITIGQRVKAGNEQYHPKQLIIQ
jgi:hypothetical protein